VNARRALSGEEQVQEDLARLEAYRNQLSSLVSQLQYLASSQGEHRRAREALEGLERIGGGPEVLIAIGADAFVRGTPASDGKVLMGVGSGVMVEMERPRASELVAQRMGRLEEAARELEGQVAPLEERIERVSRRLDAAARAAEGGSGPPLGDVGGG
jgi:prefoldin alpha subunit